MSAGPVARAPETHSRAALTSLGTGSRHRALGESAARLTGRPGRAEGRPAGGTGHLRRLQLVIRTEAAAAQVSMPERFSIRALSLRVDSCPPEARVEVQTLGTDMCGGVGVGSGEDEVPEVPEVPGACTQATGGSRQFLFPEERSHRSCVSPGLARSA